MTSHYISFPTGAREASALITAASLRSQTSKDLAQMAKKKGVPGWHSMRKEQLILALLKLAKEKAKSKTGRNGASASGVSGKRSAKSKIVEKESDSKIARLIREDRLRREKMKNLALANSMQQKEAEPTSDRIVLVVRDPFWLHCYWEVTKRTVRRAKAALAEAWFNAKPVLRLSELNGDAASAVENVVREIPIHGGVKNWYIDVHDPPKSFRISLGYLTADNRFHLIATSNEVTTPVNGNGSLDENWADIKSNYEKYYALSGGYDPATNSGELQNIFEEKLRQPMTAPAFVRLGSGLGSGPVDFPFEVDAQLVVYGATDPTAKVTLGGEPVQVELDGTFCVRMGMPDRRQVLPIVARSRDGSEQRTTVLAVERNTKVMEPVSRDFDESL